MPFWKHTHGAEGASPAAPPATHAPVEKGLNPLFGSLCRSQSFAATDSPTLHEVYFEAVLESPFAQTWSVRKVVRKSEKSAREATPADTAWHVHDVRKNVAFHQALETLVSFEKNARENPQVFLPLMPSVEALGFSHFQAFAEREGYVFDTQGQPHARTHPSALPSDAVFSEAAVESARRHVQRTAEEFRHGEIGNGVPPAHFLFDHFHRASQQEKFDSHMKSARVLAILDRYMEHLETAHDRLQSYCETFDKTTNRAGLELIHRSLDLAGSNLRQIKAYGVDVSAYETFTLQCRAAVHIVHAQSLHRLIYAKPMEDEKLKKEYLLATTEAINVFRVFDKSEKGLAQLREMIEQESPPAVPPAITLFIERYKKNRSEGCSPMRASVKTPEKGFHHE